MTAQTFERRVEDTLRACDACIGGLFTYSDSEMRSTLEMRQRQISRAVGDLERLLNVADREIAEARKSLADHPRHYGTSQ